MNILTKKMWRDLRHKWTQFFSVFLMAFLSTLVFIGMQGAWKSVELSVNTYITENHLANYWLNVSQVKPAQIAKLKKIKGIKQVSGQTEVTTTRGKDTLTLTTTDDFVTTPTLIKGEKIDAHSQNGIWLNAEYARAHKLKVGDKLVLTFNNHKARFRIKGLVQSAEHIFYTGSSDYIAPNYKRYGYAYTSQDALTSFLGHPLMVNRIQIKGQATHLRSKVEEIMGDKLIAYDSRQTRPEISGAIERAGQLKFLSYLFSSLFIILAILAMYTTIKRLVEDQQDEISVLKAFGFSRGQLLRHYLSFGLISSATGAVLGAIFSPIISNFILQSQKAMLSLPTWRRGYEWTSGAMILLIIVICLSSSYLASQKALTGLPAEFMNQNRAQKSVHLALEQIHGLWKNISYNQRWLLRDIFQNKGRTLMGIVGVCGGMMLLIAGIGMPQTIGNLTKTAYRQNFSYSKRITTSDYPLNKGTVGQWVQVSQAHIKPDGGYNTNLVIFGKGNYLHVKTVTGQKITAEGIYLTENFAKRAHIKTGQKIKLRPSLSKKQLIFKVRGILNSQTIQGAFITKKSWEKAGGTFRPTILLTGQKNVKLSQITKTVTRASQERNAQNYVKNLQSIFYLIIFLAIFLIVVILYNLGSLSFVERKQAYATLRVLGLSKQELLKLTLLENILTTFVGWILGIPAGIWFLTLYCQIFSSTQIEFTPYTNMWTYLTATIIVWGAALSSSMLLSRRITSIDMIEALKGRD